MFMLDTNICIYVINERDSGLLERFEAGAGSICISAITWAELCYGVEHSAQRRRNTRELEEFQRNLDIVPFDRSAGRHYGEIREALVRRGQPITANDLLIAAHARSMNAILVTNDERHFRRVPRLKVENWLEGRVVR